MLMLDLSGIQGVAVVYMRQEGLDNGVMYFEIAFEYGPFEAATGSMVLGQ